MREKRLELAADPDVVERVLAAGGGQGATDPGGHPGRGARSAGTGLAGRRRLMTAGASWAALVPASDGGCSAS